MSGGQVSPCTLVERGRLSSITLDYQGSDGVQTQDQILRDRTSPLVSTRYRLEERNIEEPISRTYHG